MEQPAIRKDRDREKAKKDRGRNRKLNVPFLALLSMIFLLFICALFGALYNRQKAVRAQRELKHLRAELRQETEQKEALVKRLQDAAVKEEILASARVEKQKRIDPIEAAFLEANSIPATDQPDPRIITHGDRNQKKVALTIDDGWNADNRILNLVESYGIRCTAFVIGGRNVAESHKSWLKRMDEDGFEICTHTYSHYLVTGLSNDELRRDINKGQEILTNVTGKTVPFLRTCGGVYNKRTLDIIAESGYKLVLWDVELGDTHQNSSADGQAASVLKNVKNGSIILCHFGGYHTYETLKIIIPELQKRGYAITTVSDVIGADNEVR